MERRAVRCAIYTRQSVARPGGSDFTSCDAQRDACLALVRAHAPEGWIPLEERFDDAGDSGAVSEGPITPPGPGEATITLFHVGDSQASPFLRPP